VQWLLRYRCAAGSAAHVGSGPGAATTRAPDYYLMQTRREMFPFHRSQEDLVNVNSFTSVSARTGGSVCGRPRQVRAGGSWTSGCRWSRLPATGPRKGSPRLSITGPAGGPDTPRWAITAVVSRPWTSVAVSSPQHKGLLRGFL